MLEFMKKIKLTQNKYAIIDNGDFERVNKLKWYYDSTGYAAHKSGKIAIRMHQFILNTPKGMITDHINHDKLDNRKINIRICLRMNNLWNMRKSRGKSKYKGVYFNGSDGRIKRWVAQIRANNKVKNLGYFLTEEEAAQQYNKFAKMLHGKFAWLNFIKNALGNL
mgnify:CR=1 FL=1